MGWNFAVHDVVDNTWRQICQVQVFINRALVAVFCGGKCFDTDAIFIGLLVFPAICQGFD